MKRVMKMLWLVSLLCIGTTAMARSGPPAPGTEQDIAALAQAIQSLGADVDPREAARAARITYEHTHELAIQYRITDGPLIHNTKVNMGKRPRGLCWHWAHDIEKRLKREAFQTLDLHRAVANSNNLRLEHSTAIISRRGDAYQQGIVLDPWRKGGVLFWSPTLADERYVWHPRDQVLAQRRVQKAAQHAYDSRRKRVDDAGR